MVCFVLRFAAFYRKVKEIIDSGALGEIVSIQASEGVMPWHQAHSFVRGHWSVVQKSSPMILSKCCHDTDIVHWLAGRRCRRVASFGSLEYFRPERAPAGAPARCTDGCPVGDTCPYNALRYAGDMRVPWLGWSMTARRKRRRMKSPPGCAPAHGAAVSIAVITTLWTGRCWLWSSRAA